MSILDDARSLRDELADGTTDLFCGYCGAELLDTGHDDDCRAVLMGRIVSALGAAEAVLWAADPEMPPFTRPTNLPRSLVDALGDLEIALGDDGRDEAKD